MVLSVSYKLFSRTFFFISVPLICLSDMRALLAELNPLDNFKELREHEDRRALSAMRRNLFHHTHIITQDTEEASSCLLVS